MARAASAVPIEALAGLRRRLAALSARHPERRRLMESTAQLYAISRATLYRLLRDDRRPKDAHRSDRGRPRAMPADEIERLCADRRRDEGQDHQPKRPPSVDGARPGVAGEARGRHPGWVRQARRRAASPPPPSTGT